MITDLSYFLVVRPIDAPKALAALYFAGRCPCVRDVALHYLAHFLHVLLNRMLA